MPMLAGMDVDDLRGPPGLRLVEQRLRRRSSYRRSSRGSAAIVFGAVAELSQDLLGVLPERRRPQVCRQRFASE